MTDTISSDVNFGFHMRIGHIKEVKNRLLF